MSVLDGWIDECTWLTDVEYLCDWQDDNIRRAPGDVSHGEDQGVHCGPTVKHECRDKGENDCRNAKEESSSLTTNTCNKRDFEIEGSGNGTCSETAETSVEADATACAAVADLSTSTGCEAVTTAADDSVKACTYTLSNTEYKYDNYCTCTFFNYAKYDINAINDKNLRNCRDFCYRKEQGEFSDVDWEFNWSMFTLWRLFIFIVLCIGVYLLGTKTKAFLKSLPELFSRERIGPDSAG